MNRKNLFRELLLWAVMLVPFLYLALTWEALPERVPVHFNLQGEANGWAGKTALIGIIFATTIGIYLLLLFIPNLDPKNKLEGMGSKYDQLRVLMVLFMTALATYIIYSAQNPDSLSPNLLIILVGGLIVMLGNYFQALKPNYFIGIRTPWTLESESVWRKTHRLGGRLWVAGGLLLILNALNPYQETQMVVFIAIVAVISLIPTAYSFLELRKEQRLQGLI